MPNQPMRDSCGLRAALGPRRLTLWRVLWRALGLVLCTAFVGQASDVSTTVQNGPTSNRVDLVFLGDGYQATEMGAYHEHVDGMLSHLFDSGQEPFGRYENFFNVHLIEVISNQSGADVPSNNYRVDTALDAQFTFPPGDSRPHPEFLTINETKASQEVSTSLAGTNITADVRFVTVNSTQYGGSGGFYATFAGGSEDANELALHEIGHSFGGLADEYVSLLEPYPFLEPLEKNVSTMADGSRWDQWLGYEDPVLGTVGAYEGGRYYDTGVYRPSQDSKMRTLGLPFDVVSREQLVLRIYEHVDPLDAWSDAKALVDYSEPLWVDPVDEDVIEVEWSINGAVVGTGNELDLFAADVSPGTFVVTAFAEDKTDWVRISREQLQQTQAWVVSYYPGDFNDDNQIFWDDIDALTSAVVGNSTDLAFDLDGNDVVDQLDRQRWLDGIDSQFGDANLDGVINFGDFLTLSQNFGQSAGWGQGNFDLDGVVGFSDFLALSQNFGFGGSQAQGEPLPELGSFFAIPEPNSSTLLLLGMLFLFRIPIRTSARK